MRLPPGRSHQRLRHLGVESSQSIWSQRLTKMAVIAVVVRVFNREWQPARMTGAFNQQSLVRLHRHKQHSVLMVNP